MGDKDDLDNWIHELYGKHPATFQNSATAPVAPLPEGLLHRKGDGEVRWNQPPPLPGASPAPAGADWIQDQLAFFDLAPPKLSDPAGQNCIFNGEETTLDAVLDKLDRQATLSGLALSRASAQAAASAILKTRAAAASQGAAVAMRPIGPDSIKALAGLDMTPLLDALQAIRPTGQLQELAKLPSDARMTVAILSVLQKLGEKWEAMLPKLTEADQEVVRRYIYGRMIAGDVAVVKPLANAEGSVLGDDGSDDATWTNKFLKLHRLGPNLLTDSAATATLDGKTLSIDDIIDMVAEQSAAAGRLGIDRDIVRGFVRSQVVTLAIAQPASKTRWSGSLAIAISDGAQHKDLATKAHSKDNPTVQLSAQVTFEVHPENGSGPEFSWVGQLTGFKGDDSGGTKFNWSALSGPQAVWVQSFFNGMLKVEPLVQLLGGWATAPQKATGNLKLVLTGQFAAGGQLVFTVPHTGGHLSFGVQTTAGWTSPREADTTFDVGGQGFAQWNF